MVDLFLETIHPVVAYDLDSRTAGPNLIRGHVQAVMRLMVQDQCVLL